jgi:hypothetical protein
VELIFLQDFIPPENKGPVEILIFFEATRVLSQCNHCIQNSMTIPVTVASAEQNFSKLKILNTYLQATMTQERLNALA